MAVKTGGVSAVKSSSGFCIRKGGKGNEKWKIKSTINYQL
jgi:hypothetical protein